MTPIRKGSLRRRVLPRRWRLILTRRLPRLPAWPPKLVG
nr:MAG TPA: hypothetical protein [Caudoviricetes sp.]